MNETLIENVKEWITLDNGIKEMQKKMKEYRKKKKELTQSLVEVMKNNEIDCFDIQDGQLQYTRTKTKAPLSKKHLLNSLMKYFENNKEVVEKLGTYILDSREEKIRENIKRK
tara:strand:+ start:112 stop:450 length:339 start_codon:yes stop_codon:yes gene_type:complete